MLDFQTYEYVMITADLAFGRLPPTATQWVDEVQLTAVGIRRVGMLDGLQFTPPSVDVKALPVVTKALPARGPKCPPTDAQKFPTQESTQPTPLDPRVHVLPASEVTIGDPAPKLLSEPSPTRPTQCCALEHDSAPSAVEANESSLE
jgi:hypothetical protein